MSYVRFGEWGSDVYVFLSVNGNLECCVCALREHSGRFDSTEAMIEHLCEHRAKGHTVPEFTFEGLERDRAENDAYIEEKKQR